MKFERKVSKKNPKIFEFSEKRINFALVNIDIRLVYVPDFDDCARGVIGSRARLRIWCLTTWGFESLRAHEENMLMRKDIGRP